MDDRNVVSPSRRLGGGCNFFKKTRAVVHEGTYLEIIALENLFTAWEEFRIDKKSKSDVAEFALNLEDNIFALHEDLVNGSYRHGSYQQFSISDPKPRLISKASVRDRLLHHAIYRVLYPLFDPTFIHDTYSCRVDKGTHKAFQRLVALTRRANRHFHPVYSLKCDVKKFFDSVDHQILIAILNKRIDDPKLMGLLKNIIDSFHSLSGVGMPIGNLVSQLFVNIYLDPLDKFVKHHLKAKYYIRYADDFLFLAESNDILLGYFVEVNSFLKRRLRLQIHPEKIYLRKLSWGIDFVGYVVRPHYTFPRKKTVKRMLRKAKELQVSSPKHLELALPSYIGHLQHTRAYRLAQSLKSLLPKESLEQTGQQPGIPPVA